MPDRMRCDLHRRQVGHEHPGVPVDLRCPAQTRYDIEGATVKLADSLEELS